MRRFFSCLTIGIVTLITVLVVLLFIREQRYYQLFPDYTHYASAADLQAYLEKQKLKVGKTSKAEVETFILQSGMASEISLNSNCMPSQNSHIGIGCKVRAPAQDFPNQAWINQIQNLQMEFYYISFGFKENTLTEMWVGLSITGLDL